jgi:nucleoside-diphosphate-sugar epimerase
MNPAILITGGSGLLGSYIIRYLVQKGYSNITATYTSSAAAIPEDMKDAATWLPLSLPDQVACNEIIKDKTWVIHAAGFVSYNPADKYRLLDINQTGTAQIVNACLHQGVSHFMYVSSIGALGRETNHVTLNEESVWLENEWSTSYGLSKYLGELEAWRGAAEGLPVSVILPSVILGSGDWDRSSLKMIKRVVNSAGYYPTGQTGFVDVRDVAIFVHLLLSGGMTGERWLLNGSTMSYGDMYKSIGRHLGLKKSFRPAPKWVARAMLWGGLLAKGKNLGTEILNPAYGTFSFDASKSLSIEGFQYRTLEDSLKDVAAAYHADSPDRPLLF